MHAILGLDNNELFRVQGTHEQAHETFFRPPNGRAPETGVASEPPMAAEEGSFNIDSGASLHTGWPVSPGPLKFRSSFFPAFRWCDPQRSVSQWSAWRPEASAPRRSRPRWACRNRQRSAGCGGCARTATWRRATSSDRVVRRLVCVSGFSCYGQAAVGCSRKSAVLGSAG